nr:hypothetical protein [uncultured Sphingomonas sp.]
MIELHARCYYPAYSGYQNGDFPPFKLVKALKGEAIRGFANIPNPDGSTWRLEDDTRNRAFDAFGSWAAQRLQQLGIGVPVLIPIPSSQHVDPNADFTALRMCRAITSNSNVQYPIAACLTQRHAVLGSSKGGSRKFIEIRDNLVCHAPPGQITAVLVDDVKTSGNHLKACATILRQHGVTVNHAIVAGRTVWERQADMWTVPVENADWDNEGFGFEFNE